MPVLLLSTLQYVFLLRQEVVAIVATAAILHSLRQTKCSVNSSTRANTRNYLNIRSNLFWVNQFFFGQLDLKYNLNFGLGPLSAHFEHMNYLVGFRKQMK
jgi:hypothetical protein